MRRHPLPRRLLHSGLLVCAVLVVVAGWSLATRAPSQIAINEAAAMEALKTLDAAQTDQNNGRSPHTFIDDLEYFRTGGPSGARYISDELASGRVSGYRIVLRAGAFVCPAGSAEQADTDGSPPCLPSGQYAPGEDGLRLCSVHGQPGVYRIWSAEAHPLIYGRTGRRSFFIDERSVLRGGDLKGGPATPDLPQLWRRRPSAH